MEKPRGIKITNIDKKKQCIIGAVSNCTLCNAEINYKGLCEMCYTEQKLNDLD